jgi:parallel beta-helix repeat protein
MRRKTTSSVILLIAVALFLLAFPSRGETQYTYYVDCNQQGQTIGAAIINAGEGSTINVTGTCYENIQIWWARPGIKLIGLKDSSGNPAVINGRNIPTQAVSVGAENITISGFKITQGKAGVVLYKGASAMIYGNTIEGTEGHGIALWDTATARIYDNTIQYNNGDGILVSNNSSARIGFDSQTDTDPRPNWIEHNSGNGISIANSSCAQIVGNRISENAGDGIKVARVSQADISDNTIDGNNGNGIFVTQNSGVNLGNDTGDTIFDRPNTTTIENGLFGLKGTIGGYADGWLGTLDGLRGRVLFDLRSINSTRPWLW